MSRWWRAYDEAVDDPKLILLTDRQHRTWFDLCCVTSQNGGVLPSVAVIAVKLRVKPDRAKIMVAELVALGLIDQRDGKFTMHNWEGRQFKSDGSTERVKRFRENRRNVSCNVSEAANETKVKQDQIQNTETEKKEDIRAIAVATRPVSNELFERFWKEYPRRDGANPKEPALKKFVAEVKSGDDAEQIIAGARRYGEEARRLNQIGTPYVAQAATWLNQRRWADYGEKPMERKIAKPRHGQVLGAEFGEKAAGRTFVLAETPEWDEWCRHQREQGKPAPPRYFHEGWAFPSRWPPGHEVQQEAAE